MARFACVNRIASDLPLSSRWRFKRILACLVQEQRAFANVPFEVVTDLQPDATKKFVGEDDCKLAVMLDNLQNVFH